MRVVALCLALLAQSTALTVGITGAGGKTGSLCYQQLAADSRVDAAIPFVRDASSKKTLKVLPDAPLVEADVTGSASAFAAVLKEKKAALEAAFAKEDPDASGFISYDTLQDALSAQDMELNDQVLITLMRRYDTYKNGSINYKDFLGLAA